MCVTLHHTTQGVGCLFTRDLSVCDFAPHHSRSGVPVHNGGEAGGCFCRVSDRHPIVDYAVDAVEQMYYVVSSQQKR